MSSLVNIFIKKISESNPQFTQLELKKMEYGILCFLDEVTKIIPFFIVFYLFSVHSYFLIALAFFCPIRMFTGGYHAKSYWGCFAVSFVIFSVIICISKYMLFKGVTLIIILVISTILVCIFAPVDNENKRIKSKERFIHLKIISIAITFILVLLCYIVPDKYINTAVISIFSAVLMMLVGKLNTLFSTNISWKTLNFPNLFFILKDLFFIIEASYILITIRLPQVDVEVL